MTVDLRRFAYEVVGAILLVFGVGFPVFFVEEIIREGFTATDPWYLLPSIGLLVVLAGMIAWYGLWAIREAGRSA